MKMPATDDTSWTPNFFVSFLKAATLVFCLAASLLAGWQAQAETSVTPEISESMEGRTQLEVGGAFAHNKYSGFLWDASVAGYHYIGSNFGVGGEFGLGDYSESSGLRYSVAPTVEYFFNVGSKSHLFVQGLFGFYGSADSTSNLELRASGGYRYFLTENVALQAKLQHSWYKSNSGDRGFQASESVLLRVGFSIFF